MRFILFLCLFLNTLAQALPEIHPAMQAAIDANENQIRTTGTIKNPEFIIVDGQKQFLGFNPTSQIYVAADYIEIETPDDWVMKEIDYSVLAHTPIIRQTDFSCWAQGCRTAMNMAWNSRYGYTPGHPQALNFSPQDVIDCSGLGSARSGGQISLSYPVKAGLAPFSIYPYHGGDGRCQKDVTRSHKLERAPFVRKKGGGFLDERDLNYVYHVLGPAEFCGSAGAMKSGGWVENPGGGNPNHCYGGGGMRWGPNYGKAAYWFHGTPNSWGESWGAEPKGWGWYALTHTPGGSLKNQSIAAEIQVAVTGLPLYQPGPKKFEMKGGKSKIKVTVDPGKYQADKIKKSLQRSGFKEEEASK
jgi:hypothetical protein